MSGNGRLPETSGNGAVLQWPGRVVTAEHLQRALNGHGEIALSGQAVITPLAADYLRDRKIQVSRLPVEEKQSAPAVRWGYAQQRPQPLVATALKALEREGISVEELTASPAHAPCSWAQKVADCIAAGRCCGGVVFCEDPGLVCCVANKVAGLRAVSVATVSQAARATLTLGANLLAVEMPGRTFFEVRQIVRTMCGGQGPACPPGVACTLQELDGHAHR